MTAPILQRIVNDRMTKQHSKVIEGTATPEEVDRADRFVVAQMIQADNAERVASELGELAMGSGTKEMLVAMLSIEHRTILAQIAAAVAQAVMSTTERGALCGLSNLIPHPVHDGRLTCNTIIGAATVANQPLI